MKAQERRSGPLRQGNRPDTNNLVSGQRNAETTALPTARALVFPATGRRTTDAAVVTSCPWCLRAGHMHRGRDLSGAVRESGCNPRREYVLVKAGHAGDSA